MFFVWGIHIIFVFFYVVILLLILQQWDRIISKSKVLSTAFAKVTVVIPARNEAGNIERCLRAILQQSYPEERLEIIVIDDFSTDRTAEIVKSYTKHLSFIRLLSLEDIMSAEERINSYKKKGLELAIRQSQGAIIITTDADCWMDKDWLKSMVHAFSNKKIRFVAAPVLFENGDSTLERFQYLDLMGMMGVTGGGIQSQTIHLCNGANMAFRKEVFDELGGYSGNEQFASGDDVFLLNKIAQKYPDGICFLKNRKAIVHTKSEKTWKGFFQQRMRWATKNSAYKNWKMLFVQAVVYLTCLGVLLAALFSLWEKDFLYLLGLMLVLKGGSDYFYLSRLGRFFKTKISFKDFVSNQILHVLYIAIIGTLSLFIKKYTWKGRRVK